MPASGFSANWSQFTGLQRTQFTRSWRNQALINSVCFNPKYGLVARMEGKKGNGTKARPIVIHEELTSQPGNTLRLWYPFQIGGPGVDAGVDLFASADVGGYAFQDLVIYEKWKSMLTQLEDTSNQLNFISSFSTATTQLQTAVANIWDVAACMHLAGYAPTGTKTSTSYVDHASTLIDPSDTGWTLGTPTDYPTGTSSNYRVMPTGTTNEQDITSSHPLTTSQIETSVKNAKSVNRGFAPCEDGYYYLFTHPNCYFGSTGLLADTNFRAVHVTGDANAKGAASNIAVTGLVAQWANVKIILTPYMPLGIRTDNGNVISTVRRNVLVGAHALSVGVGLQGGAPDEAKPMEFRQDHKNFGQETGIACSFWGGFKRNIFDDPRDTVSTTRMRSIVLPAYGA